MVDELLVECTHKAKGCTHTCQRQLLDIHLRESCLYADITCSEPGCTQTLMRKNATVGVDGKPHACSHHRVVRCVACSEQVKFLELEVRSLPRLDLFSTSIHFNTDLPKT